jgi:alkyl hydroperoxide reductase subunit AhpC
MDYKCLYLGDEFPNIEVKTHLGDFKLHDYQDNSWLVFMSHPRDFTPVCTSELAKVAKIIKEFDKRKTKVIALSCDTIQEHKKWVEDINILNETEVTFPIISDLDLKVSKLIGMYHPHNDDRSTIRTTYIIDPSKKVRLMTHYPTSTGRSFGEILRALDSLQITSEKSVATPENWKKGDKCLILPNLSEEETLKKFPQGWNEVKHYLRYVDV